MFHSCPGRSFERNSTKDHSRMTVVVAYNLLGSQDILPEEDMSRHRFLQLKRHFRPGDQLSEH